MSTGGSAWPRIGAVFGADGSLELTVWAASAGDVKVRIENGTEERLPATGDGLFAGTLVVPAGSRYRLVVDEEHLLPDPCSRHQPDGVRGPSEVVDVSGFEWTDEGWRGVRLEDLTIYELHVGTFSQAGTFDGVAARLPELQQLGVTAIELMPVATFPGRRNWGYDGVYAYAPHPAYGGPEGLARLVNAAHGSGLGVILDVVYNHMGPGSEAIAGFAPYFTDRHHTFWGDALDFRQRGVREWAIQNAEMWVRDYHIDGLRLDAAHAVFDDSEQHVLAELADRVRAIEPRTLVISEMETGDLRPIRSWAHDAQWADEFHHCLHVLLTGENEGYYAPYRPSLVELARQLERVPASRLVYCSQNHDQVGNRALGDRPRPHELRLRAAALLFAPQTPLVFMGEEYGEQRPFQFFTDHDDPALAEATREGRKREFERFAAFSGDVPDPQDPVTFERSKLDRSKADESLRCLYRRLLALRRTLPREIAVEADDEAGVLGVRRGQVELLLNFSGRRQAGVAPFDIAVRKRGRRDGGAR